MKYDVIIIGAGLGGLTAAAKLAKVGKKILLVEQHYVPGGCATTFKRKDFTFEVGLHEMDGLDRRDMKTKIFRDLGVFDKAEFLKVPEFYHFTNERFNVTVSHDPEITKKVLVRMFPDEEGGIDAYFEQILNARQKAKESAGQPEKSVGEFLDSIINNEDLKLILLGNLGYFHDNPYSLSLNYYSVAQGSYYSGGGNFVKGGSQKLSDSLAEIITENGGTIIYKHIVTKILTENNRVNGIVYQSVKGENSTPEKAFADIIIANNAIPNVVEMLPANFGTKLKHEISKFETGASLLTIYFGFNKPPKEIGNKYYSTFVYDKSVKSQADIIKNNKNDFDKRSFTFIDYSHVNSQLAPEGKSVGAICCIDYASDWENLEKEEYKEKKAKVKLIFTERLNKLIPGVKELIEYSEVATPLTISKYTLNPKGAVYGFAQTPERVRFNNIKSVDNLYFASAWTKIGGGFSGAIFSGYLCAFDILRNK